MPHPKVTPYPVPEYCPYCGKPVRYMESSATLYKGVNHGPVYACTKCDSYVGVHKGTKVPLGRLADKDLRMLKQVCHFYFDTLYQMNAKLGIKEARSAMYMYLAHGMGIHIDKCHFGHFTENQCHQALRLLQQYKKETGFDFGETKELKIGEHYSTDWSNGRTFKFLGADGDWSYMISSKDKVFVTKTNSIET